MNADAQGGRRERNKQEKLERITAVARELFALKGISEVTTSEIARRADIAAGTLFLYAKTKGELLLLAQNANYKAAQRAGLAASAKAEGVVAAVIALVKPIIVCNREHVENGRAYLLEVVFGDGNNVYRREAIELMVATEAAVMQLALSMPNSDDPTGHLRAKAVMSFLFLALSSPLNREQSVEQLVADIESQIKLLFV